MQFGENSTYKIAKPTDKETCYKIKSLLKGCEVKLNSKREGGGITNIHINLYDIKVKVSRASIKFQSSINI